MRVASFALLGQEVHNPKQQIWHMSGSMDLASIMMIRSRQSLQTHLFTSNTNLITEQSNQFNNRALTFLPFNEVVEL